MPSSACQPWSVRTTANLTRQRQLHWASWLTNASGAQGVISEPLIAPDSWTIQPQTVALALCPSLYGKAMSMPSWVTGLEANTGKLTGSLPKVALSSQSPLQARERSPSHWTPAQMDPALCLLQKTQQHWRTTDSVKPHFQTQISFMLIKKSETCQCLQEGDSGHWHWKKSKGWLAGVL